MKVKYSRNIWIDSELNGIGGRGGEVAQIHFPPQSFTANKGEVMRLILTSFEMRRNFYNINANNNKFYLYDPAGPTFTEIAIEQGNYTDFTTLATAIQTATAAVVGGSTCTHDALKRKFTITLGGGAPAGSFLVCFQVRQGQPPAGVSGSGFYNDSNEILGARPTRDVTQLVNAFGATTGAVAHVSPYPTNLSSIEAVYLRSGLQTNNFQTNGFEQATQDQNGLTSSTIFARVPLTKAFYDPDHEIINFEDPDELFTIILSQSQLTQITLYITDGKGRLIPQLNDTQAVDGNLSFTASLRWELLDEELVQGSRAVQIPPDKLMGIRLS